MTSGSSCSRLSSTSSSCARGGRAANSSSSGALDLLERRAVARSPPASSAASWTAARSTKTTPSRRPARTPRAAASARRVLPVPPGPVSVTSRTSSRRKQRVDAQPLRGADRAAASPVRAEPAAHARPPAPRADGSCLRIRCSSALQLRPGVDAELVDERALRERGRHRARPSAGPRGRARARAARAAARGRGARRGAVAASRAGARRSPSCELRVVEQLDRAEPRVFEARALASARPAPRQGRRAAGPTRARAPR